MGRYAAFIYGAFAYAYFLGVFLYAIGFVGDVLVPRGINDGAEPASAGMAIAINVLLLGLFGVQHSIMARPAFKRLWTKIVSPAVERSTFVLFTNVILTLIFWQWQPLTGAVWSVESELGKIALWAICGAGWVIVLLSTFVIDHFDLFGLKQVWYHFRGLPYPAPEFKVTLFYRYVRHPLLFGFMIAFWATPHMTFGRLLFAGVTTAYMLVAIQLEERDLVGAHGEDYKSYRRQVSMIIPLPPRDAAPAGRRSSVPSAT